jgi:NhaP-type Na+/H+ or K+/H+ antiporter
MIWERDLFDRNHEVIISENCLIFLLLLFLCSLSQSYLQKYYYYIPSTAVTLLISMTVSGIIRLGSGLNPNHPSQFATPFIFGFSSHIFYFGLLPPILFYSGYSLKRKYFYENFDAILMLAFAGTIMTIIIMTMGISFYSSGSSSSSSSFAAVVAKSNDKSSIDLSQLTLMDCLLLSTILSSTDPITTLAVFSNLSVHYQLYYLVFGESILNDAVSVTMYNTLINVMDNSSVKGLTSSVVGEITGEFLIVFLVSSVIGYGMGILVAFLLKKFPLKEQRRDNHPRDTRSEEKTVNNNEEEQSQVNNNININDLENPAEGSFSPSSQRRTKATATTTSASFARTTEESGGILSTLTSITSSYSSLPNHSTAHSHSSVTLTTHETSHSSSSSEENNFLSVLLLIFICYFAFFLSETFKFSGIVTIFFGGISTRRYVLKNMNHSVKDFFSQMMEIVANLMETSCFIIMGLSIFLIDFAAYRMWFIGLVILLMVVGRMISVYFLLNLVSVVHSLFYFSYSFAP